MKRLTAQLALYVLLLAGSGLPARARWQPLPDVGEESKLRGHQHEIFALAFSPDGQWLASGSFDGSTRLWDTRNWRVVHELAGHANWISAVAFSPDSRQLATASLDRRIQVWDVASGQLRHTAQPHLKGVLSLAFSPDGQWLASGGLDKRIVLHRLNPWQQARVLPEQPGGVSALAFSPDSRTLVSGSYQDSLLRCWDPVNGEAGPLLNGHLKEIYALAFSPDGQWLASAGEDRVIRLWNWPTRAAAQRLYGHAQPIWSLAFSPDSQWLASGSLGDKSLRFWTVPQGVNAQSLMELPEKTYALAFHPQQGLLASGHSDPLIRLWKDLPQQRPAALGWQAGQELAEVWATRLTFLAAERTPLPGGLRLSLRLRNDSPRPLRDLQARLTLKPVGLSTPHLNFALSELPGGETRSLEIPLQIPRTLSHSTLEVTLELHAGAQQWSESWLIEPEEIPRRKGVTP
jgi:uncharacterized protein YjiK